MIIRLLKAEMHFPNIGLNEFNDPQCEYIPWTSSKALGKQKISYVSIEK